MKMKLLLFVSIFIGSIGLSFLDSSTTYAQSAQSSLSNPVVLLANTLELDPEAEPAENPATSCAIDGIGWIICPVVRTMASVVDGAYAFVSSLLIVQPLVSTGEGSSVSVYNAWTMMRNLANVAFVVAFIIIIFSQLTSVGLNNYGIKKMLPRLIVAAILVNVSFWICAIAVDISNIAGSSLNSVMQGLATTGDCSLSPKEGVANTCLEIAMKDDDPAATGTGWAGIAGLVIAGGVIAPAVLYATLSALLPALLAAVVAIVTVFLVLTLRQALIILLIIVSPLAFVAYLLPNTEQLFKKWMAMFKTLLLMYPIIAMIFGASALASTIVMNAAPKESDYRVAIQIMGALISIIPLALTPVVMKTAGGVLNRFGGIINNPNKGPIDKLRKKAEGYRDYKQDLARGNRLARGTRLLEGSGKGLGDQYSKRRRVASLIASAGATHTVNAEKQKGFAKAVADETGQEYFAKRALNQEGFAEKITGDKNKAVSLQASSQTAVDKLDIESVKSREVLLRAKFDPRDLQNEAASALAVAIKGNDEVGARAAQSILLNSGAPGLEKLASTIQNAETNNELGSGVSTSLRKDINGAGLKGRDNTLATWSYTNDSLNNISTSQATYAGLSDKELIGQSPANLQRAVAAGAISGPRAAALLANDNLGVDFNEAKRSIIGAIATSTPVAQTPASQTPVTLNIQHNNMPPSANPSNARTSPPPNTSGFNGNNQTPSGLHVPNGYQQNPPNQPPSGPNPPNTP